MPADVAVKNDGDGNRCWKIAAISIDQGLPDGGFDNRRLRGVIPSTFLAVPVVVDKH